MAYKKKPRAEDPNAESRTQFAPTIAVAPPAAPQVQNPAGGAPKLVTDPGIKTPQPKPTDFGGYRQWYSPTPIKQQPWQQNPVQPPTDISIVRPNRWKLQDIAKNEPEFVNEFKNRLWERYQNAGERERRSIFWQGVKQNPELAAASFVRRALQNMADANSWINGEGPPRLSSAIQNTLANNDTRQWLEWVRGNGKMPKVGD